MNLRGIQQAIGRVPGIGLVRVPTRTASFMVRSWLRERRVPVYPDLPAPKLSLGLTAQVLLDEALLGLFKSPRRYPTPEDYPRIGEELRRAAELYRREGWLDDPEAYHAAPLPPRDLARLPARWRDLEYERISFQSDYAPHPEEPGRERWIAHAPNHRAWAWVLRHPEPRPWLLCLHGFGMGRAFIDFHAFRAARLHRELGLNLIFPVLPLHGPRKVSRLGGSEFMSFDLMQSIFGLSQSIFDVRTILRWLRESEGAETIGVYGLSLGSYTAAVVAGLEDGLDAVIAGIPPSDLPRLYRYHASPSLRRRAVRHGIFGETLYNVHRVVSPLSFEPRVAPARRFIYAALGDRLSTPAQAHQLWMHWKRPSIAWYDGTHVGFLLSPQVDSFVREALLSSGLCARDAPAGGRALLEMPVGNA